MRSNRRFKYIVACACVLLCVCYLFGVGDYVQTKNFDTEFDYPLNVDIRPIVHEMLNGLKPQVKPINFYPFKYLTNIPKCRSIDKIDLVIAVKSAMAHFGHRKAIRQTYGQGDYIPGRIIKTVFFIGINNDPKSDVQNKINEEIDNYQDIIQIDFLDNYYNNTIKTMMSFRWLYERCSSADFYLFTDDDMYISVGNLLNYAEDLMTRQQISANNSTSGLSPYLFVENLNTRDKNLFAGYMFPKSAPQRYLASKWRISLADYPYDRWPAYITAGAYVVSNRCMKTLYIGSLYTKHFRFDDIYLGIVARKVGVLPTHCPQFYFYKLAYNKETYRSVIASHGYDNHEELIKVWREQVL